MVRCQSQILLSLISSCLLVHASSGRAATLIYEAFNEKFSELVQQLPVLQEFGVSHVLISPPQKSLDRPEWWARYQPIDYRYIDSPLGQEDDLARLSLAAKDYGISIIVDAVLNHMADVRYFPSLAYPQFSAQDFHTPQQCIENFSDRFQAVNAWLCDERATLPDLKTESPYVRGIQADYLSKLLRLGVGGFRFDAAVNMEADYFTELKKTLPQGLFNFGEVVGTSIAESRLYAKDLVLTDFWLLRDMIRIFQANQPLQNLSSWAESDRYLGQSHIAFTRTHDGLFHADFFNFSDEQALGLGYAYVLTAGYPISYVLNHDMQRADVKAAMKFRKSMDGLETRFLQSHVFCGGNLTCATPLAAWVRGEQGLVIMNNSQQWQNLPKLSWPLQGNSCYIELQYRFQLCHDERGFITSWAGQSQASIGPRTALFFVKS